MDAERGLLVPPPPPYSEEEADSRKVNGTVVSVRKGPFISSKILCCQISAEFFLGTMWIILAPFLLFLDPTHEFLMTNRIAYASYMIPVDILGVVSIVMLIYAFRNSKPSYILPTIAFQCCAFAIYFVLLCYSLWTVSVPDTPLGDFIVKDFLMDYSDTCVVGSDRFIRKTAGMMACICAGILLYMTAVIFLYVRLYFYYYLVEKARNESRNLRTTTGYYLIFSPLLHLLGVKPIGSKCSPKECCLNGACSNRKW